jgi:acyl carrier protein
MTDVHSEMLDCAQVNLAVLADWRHGPGTHHRLGAVLRFQPRPVDDLPSVERSVEEQVSDSEELLGLPANGSWAGLTGAELVGLLDAHPMVYVVADAYHLSWLPYHGRRHMTHSFLLGPGPTPRFVTVIDAYHTDTEWGPVRPGEHVFQAVHLAAAVPDGARAWTFGTAGRPEPPARLDVDTDAIDGYVAAYRDHPDRVVALDRLALETWLLSRQRHLHALYTGTTEAAADQLHEWRAVTEQTYLAGRRVHAGRAESPGLYERLAAVLRRDTEVFGGAAAEVGSQDLVADAVRDAVCAALRVSPDRIAEVGSLTEISGFGSFRVVEIVERIEDALRVEFDPDDLVPEHLHRIADLCAATSRAVRRTAVPVGGMA